MNLTNVVPEKKHSSDTSDYTVTDYIMDNNVNSNIYNPVLYH